jgi:hypothetical protein
MDMESFLFATRRIPFSPNSGDMVTSGNFATIAG